MAESALNIAWLSTWNTKCGISEYSRYLAPLIGKDNHLTVFGSKNYGDYALGLEDPDGVKAYVPTFGVLPWTGEAKDHSFDIEPILAYDYDILHVQYEVMLYNAPKLYELLTRFKGKKVVTYHDNCIPPDFPYYTFHLQYTHRDDVGVGEGYIIPVGIHSETPVVKTFGLGRSKKELIEEICNRNGWKFVYSFGEEKWVHPRSLFKWLRDSDAIVLYYDDAPAAGTSIAARVAIGTRRPVIVNDVTWFAGINTQDANVVKVHSPDQLETALQDLLFNKEIEDHSWENVAQLHIDDYKELLCA